MLRTSYPTLSFALSDLEKKMFVLLGGIFPFLPPRVKRFIPHGVSSDTAHANFAYEAWDRDNLAAMEGCMPALYSDIMAGLLVLSM